MTRVEIGLQFHLPTHRTTTVRELQEIARSCANSGVDQVWFTDNLGSRNLFVLLAALAPIPIRLGAAVMVQYFRSPIEAAAALATVSELMDGRELSVGLGRGNFRTSDSIEMPKAITFMRETTRMLRELWMGNQLVMASYPLVANYFHFVEGSSVQLSVRPASAPRIYGGGSGPLGVKAAYELMDGMVLNGTMFLPALSLGRLPEMIGDARPAGFRRIADLKISVHRDALSARDFARHSVAQRMVSLRKSGLGKEEFDCLGIELSDVERIDAAYKDGQSRNRIEKLVSDAMVDAVFIAGDPGYCRERIREIAGLAEGLGINQLMFSEVGAGPGAAIRTLLDEVVLQL